MKKSLLFCCIFITSLSVFSQKPYSSAIGTRVEANTTDYPCVGLSYKHYTDEKKSFEFIAQTDLAHGIDICGLFIYNLKLPDVPNAFRLVLGGGGDFGSWSGYNDDFVIGVATKVGAEYTFDFMPLNVEIDWKPVFNIVTDKKERFWPMKLGATIRYTLKGIKGSSKSSKKR